MQPTADRPGRTTATIAMRPYPDRSSNPAPPLGVLCFEPAVLALTALGAAFFARVLFFGQTLYFRDLYLLYLPQKKHLAAQLSKLEPPLWNPFFHGGTPLLADISNAALYPSNLLYLLLDPRLAFNLDIALHTIAASVAAYLLARTLGLSPMAATLTGLVFAYSGYALSLINLLVVHLARPYLPLMLVTWHRSLVAGRSRERRFFVAATIGLGVLQVAAGGPEMIALTHGMLLLWTLAVARRGQIVAAGMHWLGTGIAIAAVGAVQLLPTASLVARTSRGAGMSFERFTTWSLPPLRLGEMVVPGFFGPTDTYRELDYWGGAKIDQGFPYVLSIYLGLIVLTLALAGARRAGPLGTRLRFYLVALTGLGTMLALGRHLPGFALLYDGVPPVRLFRFPIKLLHVAILPIALLAAAGLDALARHHNERWWRWPTGILGAGSALAALAALALLTAPTSAAPWVERLFGFVDAHAVDGLAQAFLHSAAFAGFAALLLAGRKRWTPSVVCAALVVLVGADLTTAGRRVNAPAPGDLLDAEPPLLTLTRRHIGDGRLYRPDEPAIQLPAPSDDGWWRYRRNLERLAFYTATGFDVPVVLHGDYHGLAPRGSMRLRDAVSGLPWQRRAPPLRAAGVTLVLSHEQLPETDFRKIEESPWGGGPRLGLYALERVPPSARAAHVWQAASDEDQALRAITHPRFDPARHVVVEGDEDRGAPTPCPEAARVQRTERSIDHAHYQVLMPCPGYLVLNETFDPGWRTRVDGTPAPQVRANIAYSAVWLDTGSHLVTRRYRPKTVAYGAAISIASASLLLGAWFVAGRRRSWH